MKGMAAYAHHAWVLGYQDETVNRWFLKGLAGMLDEKLGLNDLVGLAMEFGGVNLTCMEVLDRANTDDLRPSRADAGADYAKRPGRSS